MHGKIGLGERDFAFGRVAVLGDEVTGVTREGKVVNLPLSTFPNLDHFVDINEMIRNSKPRIFTGAFGFFDGM